MGKSAVRCGQCGAKNIGEEAIRCRLCGALLPDAHKKRMMLAGAVEGPSFSDLVESEVGSWRTSNEPSIRKTKRIYEAPPPKNVNVGMTLVVALVVACAVIVGAAQMLIV